VQKIIDTVELTAQWFLASPQGRREILCVLQREVARTHRRWQFHPVPTDHYLVIGQSTLLLSEAK